MTVIQGDCLDVMTGMESASVDLILTSPPYDNLRRYGGGPTFDFEGVAGQCERVLKCGGVLVWVVGDQTRNGSESGTSFRQALHFMSIGLLLNDTMIYRKSNPVPATRKRPRYTDSFDFMFVMTKGRPRTVNLILDPCLRADECKHGTHRSSARVDRDDLFKMKGYGTRVRREKPKTNIWSYGVGGIDYGHPAVFPLQLAIDHILSWTDPGDVVLDPFLGSGTTLEACLKTARHGVGIEIDPRYFPAINRRLESASTPLFAGVRDA